jgi:probable HAF family extracellular repeat protein
MKSLSRRFFGLLSATFIVGLLLPGSLHAQPSLTMVGGPNDHVYYVYGVSNDGIVVGGGVTPDGRSLAVRWSATTGVTYLEPLPGDIYSTAYAISPNGAVTVGVSFSRDAHATYWDAEGHPIDPGIAPFSQFFAVSESGRVLAGQLNLGAFQWTQATGTIDLGHLPGNTEAVAYGAANSGAIVGTSARQAFRWTKTGGMIGLGFLAGDDISFAKAVSRNGQIVTGYSGNSFTGIVQPFLWTKQTGMVGLGLMPGTYATIANGMTADGSMVIGETSDFIGGGFIWTADQGMRAFTEVLTTDYGLGAEVEALDFIQPMAVSANGRYIVGSSLYGTWIFDRGR